MVEIKRTENRVTSALVSMTTSTRVMEKQHDVVQVFVTVRKRPNCHVPGSDGKQLQIIHREIRKTRGGRFVPLIAYLRSFVGVSEKILLRTVVRLCCTFPI